MNQLTITQKTFEIKFIAEDGKERTFRKGFVNGNPYFVFKGFAKDWKKERIDNGTTNA